MRTYREQVSDEVNEQARRWGAHHDAGHSMMAWSAILLEQIGKAAKVAVEAPAHTTVHRARFGRCLVVVAAVCESAYHALGCREYDVFTGDARPEPRGPSGPPRAISDGEATT